MSRITEEIINCMINEVELEHDMISAKFLFKENFIGFKGHFPDNPILPGICMIQIPGIVFQEWNKKKYVLKEIQKVKLLKPIYPNEEISCRLTDLSHDSNTQIIDAVLIKKGIKAASMTMAMVPGLNT